MVDAAARAGPLGVNIPPSPATAAVIASTTHTVPPTTVVAASERLRAGAGAGTARWRGEEYWE